MPSLASYVLDRESIRLDAYRLLCLFYANKEIARRSDPVGEFPDAAAKFEEDFFGRELTRLLLSLAIGLRTLDDQMEGLPSSGAGRTQYLASRAIANEQFGCVIGASLTLREVCNKIIHATGVEPLQQEASGPHEYDEMYLEDAQEQGPIRTFRPGELIGWEHFAGVIRLAGSQRREPWEVLLSVPTFVEAIHVLLSVQDGKRWHVESLN